MPEKNVARSKRILGAWNAGISDMPYSLELLFSQQTVFFSYNKSA
jgi:hypothetical protein